MRKLVSITAVMCLALALTLSGNVFACGKDASSANAKLTCAGKSTADLAAKTDADKTIVLSVKDMHCNACVTKITNSLAKVDGVSDVKVSLEDGTAKVTYDGDKVKTENLTAAVVNAGFKADMANAADCAKVCPQAKMASGESKDCAKACAGKSDL